jgi:ribonucleoside-diphosphate reductase alpha chain
MQSEYIKQLPVHIQEKIAKNGIRNSHLTSIAPTGTISLTADNVSSGIEPPFSMYYDRTVNRFDGSTVERVDDYAYRQGVRGLTANEISADDHVAVLTLVQKYIDSAVSKTCNVSDDVTFDKFKTLYWKAWKHGAKGITTFRAAGKRYGVLNEVKDDSVTEGAEACFIDPETGKKTCD